MTLVILLSLKTMESLENGLQSHSGVTPLFSMTAVSQSYLSVDASAQCKRALSLHIHHSRSFEWAPSIF